MITSALPKTSLAHLIIYISLIKINPTNPFILYPRVPRHPFNTNHCWWLS